MKELIIEESLCHIRVFLRIVKIILFHQLKMLFQHRNVLSRGFYRHKGTCSTDWREKYVIFNIFTGQSSYQVATVDNLHSSHCVAVKVNDDGTLYEITYPQLCTKSLPTLCEKSTRGMTCIFLSLLLVLQFPQNLL